MSRRWGVFEQYGYADERLISEWTTYDDAWCAYQEQYTASEREELHVEIVLHDGYEWTTEY